MNGFSDTFNYLCTLYKTNFPKISSNFSFENRLFMTTGKMQPNK